MAQLPLRASKRPTNRSQALLDASAKQFAQRGFHGTTTRDITTAAAMTSGSIYSHFSSKDALLLAVYTEGVQRLLAQIDAAVQGADSAWGQLEAAVTAHLEAILDQSDYARVMIRVQPEDVPSVASELRALRNQVETRYRALIAKLELSPDVDRKFLRLLLLGAMNWSPIWFHPGKDSTRRIARNFLSLLPAGRR
jgi:TetR/AcrR family transcriptional regulator, cholesterol catabolism regulator